MTWEGAGGIHRLWFTAGMSILCLHKRSQIVVPMFREEIYDEQANKVLRLTKNPNTRV